MKARRTASSLRSRAEESQERSRGAWSAATWERPQRPQAPCQRRCRCHRCRRREAHPPLADRRSGKPLHGCLGALEPPARGRPPDRRARPRRGLGPRGSGQQGRQPLPPGALPGRKPRGTAIKHDKRGAGQGRTGQGTAARRWQDHGEPMVGRLRNARQGATQLTTAAPSSSQPSRPPPSCFALKPRAQAEYGRYRQRDGWKEDDEITIVCQVAVRRLSLRRSNMEPILRRRLSRLTVTLRELQPGMQGLVPRPARHPGTNRHRSLCVPRVSRP